MEQRAMMWRVIAAASAVGAVCAIAVLAQRPTPARSHVAAPVGVRIRVQVLNATATAGLGRRATAFLRDRGFDVVEVATAPQQRDSTLVIDRSGQPGWATLVAHALGRGQVQSVPDSSRYLDVTVLVGRDWSPPAEPFYP